MITFKKIRYNEIPDQITERIINWSDNEIRIDNTGLTRAQLQKLIDFLQQEGYKESP